MPIERPISLTESIAKYLRQAIIGGEYSPGSRLPEITLAKDLDVSRGTVREALRALSDTGLVDVVPRRGVFVSQLSIKATWEITSLRALLEPYAARLALDGSGNGQRLQQEVAAAFEVLRTASGSGDPMAVADADVAFHRSVFARCGHKMLLAQLSTLQTLSRRLVLTNQLYAADAPTLIPQHAPIADAVMAGDADAVEVAVRSHVIEAGELLLSRMASTGGALPDAPVAAEAFGPWPR